MYYIIYYPFPEASVPMVCCTHPYTCFPKDVCRCDPLLVPFWTALSRTVLYTPPPPPPIGLISLRDRMNISIKPHVKYEAI